ncbi:MAG: hypothetical protein HRU20_27405, partial [Pseudomonadales bacterium]|nr:hypothetical protein [Pseudomonadales bacterium]
EVARSKIFLAGVYQAIQDLLDTQDRINILYAGTGPYGLLLVPLLPLFKKANIVVTLLEVNQLSIEAVEKLVKALGVEDCIDQIILADATQWQPSPGKAFDLIISETMKAMLRREPQLSVFSHLQQFLAENGQLIPAEISLDAWLSDSSFEQKIRMGEVAPGSYQPKHISRFFQLDLTTAKQLYAGDHSSLQGEMKVPDYDVLNNQLKMTTEIRVYKDHVLREYQSDLTLPQFFHKVKPKPGCDIDFSYRFDPLPKFHFNFDAITLDENLPDIDDVGKLGLYGIKRIWHKAALEKQGKNQQLKTNEFEHDRAFMDALGIGLEQWLAQAYQCKSFDQFESWLASCCGELTALEKMVCNDLLMDNK